MQFNLEGPFFFNNLHKRLTKLHYYSPFDQAWKPYELE